MRNTIQNMEYLAAEFGNDSRVIAGKKLVDYYTGMDEDIDFHLNPQKQQLFNAIDYSLPAGYSLLKMQLALTRLTEYYSLATVGLLAGYITTKVFTDTFYGEVVKLHKLIILNNYLDIKTPLTAKLMVVLIIKDLDLKIEPSQEKLAMFDDFLILNRKLINDQIFRFPSERLGLIGKHDKINACSVIEKRETIRKMKFVDFSSEKWELLEGYGENELLVSAMYFHFYGYRIVDRDKDLTVVAERSLDMFLNTEEKMEDDDLLLESSISIVKTLKELKKKEEQSYYKVSLSDLYENLLGRDDVVRPNGKRQIKSILDQSEKKSKVSDVYRKMIAVIAGLQNSKIYESIF